LLNKEYVQLLEETERIAQSTTFNGKPVIKGESESGTMDFHVGIYAGSDNKIQFEADETDATTSNLGIDGSSIESKSDANSSIEKLDEALEKIVGFRATLGSIQSRLT